LLKLLLKIFVKNNSETESRQFRVSVGLLSGFLGAVCNIVLFAVKLSAGLLTGSVSFIADAFNNLSDLGSCFITILGFKLSARTADKSHPFGYGRVEYIASMVLRIIIVFVGFELAKTSFMRILSGDRPQFNMMLSAIVFCTVPVKVWMGFYNRFLGKKINSEVLKAISADSFSDALATGAVVLASAVSLAVEFPLDGVVGTLIGAVIIFNGIKIAIRTASSLLGKTPEPELVEKILGILGQYNEIVGTHDLIIHDYGAGRLLASVHAEVPHNADFVTIHEVVDKAESDVKNNTGVMLTIHADPIFSDDERSLELKAQIEQLLCGSGTGLSLHDFRLTQGKTVKNVIFDLCVPRGTPDAEKMRIEQTLVQKIAALDASIVPHITVESSYV
jgi:cation diffusion facilitator family transporter